MSGQFRSIDSHALYDKMRTQGPYPFPASPPPFLVLETNDFERPE